jgi:ATPase subunit of ABC transporter with duplicated ATPase domains
MPATAISAVRLSFAHDDAVPLFDDLSFQLGPGFAGLVGDNGAGKTTLLRLLAGQLAPSSGHVRREAATVVLCEQEVESVPDVDAVLDSHRLRGQLGLAEEDLARWATLSPGERKRWQIGAALAAGPDLLLLDEPTNHLDAAGRKRLVAALRGFRGVGVIVSHDRALLDELTATTLRLDGRGGLAVYRGGYSAAKAQWEGAAAAEVERRAAARDRVRAAEKAVHDARREHASAAHQRSVRVRGRGKYDSDARSLGAANLVEWAEKGIGKRLGTRQTELARASAELAALPALDKDLGRRLELEWTPPTRRVLLQHDGDLVAGDTVLAPGLRVSLGAGDRVHLAGDNGAGKSTLIRALLAGSTLPEGKLFHLPQELGEPPTDLHALPPAERGRTLQLCAALGADPDRLLATRAPSPGEARKLAIAAALARQVWLLVLDEPTNHLDLPAVERLEAALVAYPGALLVVSHDQRFADALCTSRWTLAGGRLT